MVVQLGPILKLAGPGENALLNARIKLGKGDSLTRYEKSRIFDAITCAEMHELRKLFKEYSAICIVVLENCYNGAVIDVLLLRINH